MVSSSPFAHVWRFVQHASSVTRSRDVQDQVYHPRGEYRERKERQQKLDGTHERASRYRRRIAGINGMKNTTVNQIAATSWALVIASIIVPRQRVL